MGKIINVSIALCTYNGAKYLREQLDSLVAQTYPIYECIIVDDGSTDETINILKDYANRHSNWHIYQNENNLGYNKNFEKALNLTTGDMIAICDQDDIWLEEKIEVMIKKWDKKVGLIYSNSLRFKGIAPHQIKKIHQRKRFSGTDVRKLFLFNAVTGHDMMIKKEIIQLALPFENHIFYDWWLAVVASCNGGIMHTTEYLVHYRIHEKNIYASKTAQQKLNRELLYKIEMLAYFKKFASTPNLPKNAKIYLQKLTLLWTKSLYKTFYWPLFLFLLSNRHIIFQYKKDRMLLIAIAKIFKLVYNPNVQKTLNKD